MRRTGMIGNTQSWVKMSDDDVFRLRYLPVAVHRKLTVGSPPHPTDFDGKGREVPHKAAIVISQNDDDLALFRQCS